MTEPIILEGKLDCDYDGITLQRAKDEPFPEQLATLISLELWDAEKVRITMEVLDAGPSAEGGGAAAQGSPTTAEAEAEPGNKPLPNPVPNISPDGSYKQSNPPKKKGLVNPGNPGHCDG